MKTMFTAALLCAAFAGQAQTETPNHTLTVNIGQFKAEGGKVFVALLDPSEKPVQRLAVPLKNNTTQVQFHNVAPGTYAIRFFHDENNNQVLDKGIFGVPKEGWGCSNDVKATFGPPDFKNMLFSFSSDKTIALRVN